MESNGTEAVAAAAATSGAATASDGELMTALAALGTMATVTIYWASLAAANEEPEEDTEEISSENAMWMPITGSIVLFGLYLVFRFLPIEYLHIALAGFISLMGAYSLARNVYRWLMQRFPVLGTISTPFHLSLKKGDEVYMDEHFDWVYLGVLAGALAVATVYMVWKPWALTNVLGLSLAFHTLRLLKLDSFKTGIILLSGLFLYDIFWVFGTEVMVTVARSFDAPIKIVFPYNIFAPVPKLAMLGLGDIVVPGIFTVLALRFDRRHLATHGAQHYSKPYFTATLIGYTLGLLTTFGVMMVFRAAQPALLYLSPACIFAVLGMGLARGELAQVWSFGTSPPAPAVGATPTATPAAAGAPTSTPTAEPVTAAAPASAVSSRTSRKSAKESAKTK